LASYLLLDPIHQRPGLLWAFVGAVTVLVAWGALLYGASVRASRTLIVEVAIRKHHWVQALAQVVVYAWWGWHARFVYAFLPLILAQVLFAYAVDALLTWSRRDTWYLGFGPLPVVLSVNLFLWFRPDWFHWQFAIILVGYLGKELIRWHRGDRSAHIFNPSSFPLAVFSLALILTGTSDITLGREIANTQFDAPHIYLVIFLASLPGQVLFGVARMTMPAVVTMYLVSMGYFEITGTYLFYDVHIPVPVFLGMHLLFTDPSTSPRSESGRILFGVMYALGTIFFWVLLSSHGVPTFYDKLLPVPLMNLTVRAIDRLVKAKPLAALDPTRIGASLSTVGRHAAYTTIWAGAFVALLAVQGVGDEHPGQYLPFWEDACEAGSRRACEYQSFLEFVYCTNGSAWACNEWAIGEVREDPRTALQAFRRACERNYEPACGNAERLAEGARNAGTWARSLPPAGELPILLRGTKPPLEERDPERLRALACDQGWDELCSAGIDAFR
jgi:hypothetical protein